MIFLHAWPSALAKALRASTAHRDWSNDLFLSFDENSDRSMVIPCPTKLSAQLALAVMQLMWNWGYLDLKTHKLSSFPNSICESKSQQN